MNYLTYFIQHYGLFITLCVYVIFCFIVTFLFTSLFCPVTTSQPKSAIHPIHNIDFIKILLTYGIVLLHQYQAFSVEKNAFYCVEGFFIISGFLLHYTYYSQNSFKDFILKKFVCFMPYIILSNMLMLFLYYSFNSLKFFSGIFMFACTAIFPEHTYYGPTWYLIVLFWISLFYFALLKTCKKEVCGIIIGIIIFIALSSTHNVIYPGVVGIENISHEIPFFTNAFIRGFVGIGLGYFLANLCSFQTVNTKTSLLLYTLLEVFLLIYLALAFFTDIYSISYIMVLISFCILFWLFFNHKSYLSAWLEKINWRPVSKYMLAIFMTHWFICQLQGQFNLWVEYQKSTRIVLCLICSTVLGFFAYHIVNLGYLISRRLRKG